MFDWTKDPHRRFNPLTREWVLVSPHRTDRPWQGQMEDEAVAAQPDYDPNCYLCPGNSRAGGVRNPAYSSTFVFDNDFAALKPGTPLDRFEQDGLLLAESEPGLCRVVCFSPRHNLTIANMEAADLRKVVDTWVEQYLELGARPEINYVQIFENRGAMMGASNPHPHCQIWSSHAAAERSRQGAGVAADVAGTARHVPVVRVRAPGAGRRRARGGRERGVPDRGAVLGGVAVRDDGDRQTPSLLDRATAPGRSAMGWRIFCSAPRRATIACSNVSFPYSMGFHQRPTDGAAHDEHHLHLHFYPPLLRSATVRKFLVGYEMLATPQRDITAESAAARLRGV